MWNGQELVACPASQEKIDWQKHDHGFTESADAAGLARLACERWIYHLLMFRSPSGRAEAGRVSPPVLELPDRVKPEPDFPDRYRVFQSLIDRSRVLLDLKTIKTIPGYKHRPKSRQRKSQSCEGEVAVEKPS
jgi:hypothetical protein